MRLKEAHALVPGAVKQGQGVLGGGPVQHESKCVGTGDWNEFSLDKDLGMKTIWNSTRLLWWGHWC